METTQNTTRVITVLGEICKLIPSHLCQKITTQLKKEAEEGTTESIGEAKSQKAVKTVTPIKLGLETRSFSLWSQVVSMVYCHLAQCVSLNDICDSLSFHKGKLNLIRNASAPHRSTLSHANTERSSEFIKRLFWEVMDHLKGIRPDFFEKGGRCFMRYPNRFKRTIHAIDSTTIELIGKCMDWAKHRKRKAAAKLHMALDAASFLPVRVISEPANHHDNTYMVELCAGLKDGEIAIFDKAYVAFAHLNTLTEKNIFWVTRAKENMDYEVVKKLNIGSDKLKEESLANQKKRKYPIIISDEEIRLKGKISGKKYPKTMRLVKAKVLSSKGEEKELSFISNNMEWAPSSICDLYRCRWAIETFFKEIKQTLKIRTFIGYSRNGIEWQLWSGLLAYVLMRYLAFIHEWKNTFKHFFTFIKGAIWVPRKIESIVRSYGTAKEKVPIDSVNDTPYLLGLNWDILT